MSQEQFIETATVLTSDEAGVELECVSRSACASCHQASTCGTGTIAKAFATRTQRIFVANKHIHTPLLPLHSGEQVQLALASTSVLSAASLVYLLPLLFLIIGSVLGQYVREYFALSESLVIFSAFASLGLGFYCTRFAAKRLQSRFKPLRVIARQ